MREKKKKRSYLSIQFKATTVWSITALPNAWILGKSLLQFTQGEVEVLEAIFLRPFAMTPYWRLNDPSSLACSASGKGAQSAVLHLTQTQNTVHKFEMCRTDLSDGVPLGLRCLTVQCVDTPRQRVPQTIIRHCRPTWSLAFVLVWKVLHWFFNVNGQLWHAPPLSRAAAQWSCPVCSFGPALQEQITYFTFPRRCFKHQWWMMRWA